METRKSRSLQALAAEVEAQRRQIETLTRQVSRLQSGSGPAAAAMELNGSHSRRDLLKLAGAAVVGAAGAAAVAARPLPAHAADGDNLVIGQANTAQHETLLTSTQDNSLHLMAPANTRALVAQVAQASGEDGGAGVVGYSPGGYGVVGQSLNGIDLLAYGTGRLVQVPYGDGQQAGPPTTGAHAQGEQVVDARGDLYINRVIGTPGQWNAVGNFRTFADPRFIYGQTGNVGDVSDPIDALHRIDGAASGVPSGARAVYCTVQALPSDSGAYLILYPDGGVNPGIANFSGPVPNIVNVAQVMVPLSSSAKFRVHFYTLSGRVNVFAWGYVI